MPSSGAALRVLSKQLTTALSHVICVMWLAPDAANPAIGC